MDYISEDEAWAFMTDVLKMSSPKLSMEQDRLQFLHSICQAYQNKIPFHNADFISIDPENGKVPSLQENVCRVINGYGGLCWTLNSAMYCLLKSIGYDVFLVLASAGGRDTCDHAVVVAKHVVKDGDSYLIDVGYGEPGFQAVCLDFDEESMTIMDSFWVYRIIKEEDLYIRVGYSRHRDANDPVWKEQYCFKLEPCEPDDMVQWMHEKVYTNSEILFYKSLRINMFVDNKMIAIKDDTILLENTDHKLEPTSLTSNQDIKDAVIENFPMLSVEEVTKAVQSWRQMS